ncbi:uncharacterized protein C8R40DRAFT_1173732 [Lentinula edodes]|uniref:uncharacterized protein n=1 Tax=Lentinula edodes TaxID=5353 RepID=UPI001E8E7D1E|nr:uncharacterized protein C8R40DRAFT_1173732 [Lentinula edodes]KAH7872330.1 hypothetical protein C8R40DRAFT_1173732 [Lentinula edodes]
MLKSSDNTVPVSISQLHSTSQSRRNSTATVDDAVRYLRSGAIALSTDMQTSSLTSYSTSLNRVNRYMSPRYVLLGSQIGMVVDSAAQAMQHVASTVGEARRRQDVVAPSAPIASRLLYSHILHSPYPSPLQALTPGFLSSLGPWHIAGSLDVIHQRSTMQSTGTANINVNYLGHTSIDIGSNWTTSKSSRQYNLNLGFHASFVSLATGTSLNLPQLGNRKTKRDGKWEIVPSMLDHPYETIVPLPIINSVPELASDNGDQLTETLLDALATESQMLQAGDTSSPEVPSIPNRRSSSTFAQAFTMHTSPEYETFVISRNLPAARAEIDAGLSNVISDICICLSTRSQAATQEE